MSEQLDPAATKTAPLNALAVASLSLLAERPMHPYEMYQLLIERAEDRVLKVRPGTLYHAVGRLAEAQLVRAAGTKREGNRPERTSYEITVDGRTMLAGALRSMLATPAQEFPQFTLALSEAHHLPRDEVIDLLAHRIELLTQDLGGYEAELAKARSRSVPERYLVDSLFQQELRTTELAWLRQFLSDLADGSMPWGEDSMQWGETEDAPRVDVVHPAVSAFLIPDESGPTP